MEWRSFVRKGLVNLKEKELDVRIVNIIKKCFGISTGNGNVRANLIIYRTNS